MPVYDASKISELMIYTTIFIPKILFVSGSILVLNGTVKTGIHNYYLAWFNICMGLFPLGLIFKLIKMCLKNKFHKADKDCERFYTITHPFGGCRASRYSIRLREMGTKSAIPRFITGPY